MSPTFNTVFSTPDALTGLVVTAVPDSCALLVAWDVSALIDEEFYAYQLDAAWGDEPGRRITTITAKSTVSYLWWGAPTNADVTFRLSQDNGFDESEPIEADGRLDLTGVWGVRPDEPVNLRWPGRRGYSETPRVRREEYEPAGRLFPVSEQGDSYGMEGRFSGLTVLPEDRAIITTIQRWERQHLVVAWKLPDSGTVRYGIPSDVGVTREFLIDDDEIYDVGWRISERDPVTAGF